MNEEILENLVDSIQDLITEEYELWEREFINWDAIIPKLRDLLIRNLTYIGNDK